MSNEKSKGYMGCKAIALAAFAAIGMAFGVIASSVTVTGVTAQQRYPWNGMVDIMVTFSGMSSDVLRAECSFVAINTATQMSLPVVNIICVDGASGSVDPWTRHFIWDSVADVGSVKIEDVSLTVKAEIPSGGVQLWENGPYWAECNVGATKPEEYGYYFWWGDAVGYKHSSGWVSVKDGSSYSFMYENCPTLNMSDSELRSAGYIDSTGNLVAAHDAATAYLGAPWRMPTDTEFTSLINNCDTIWTSRNGVYGRLVTGRGAYSLKSIFLPAAGYGSGTGFYDSNRRGMYRSSSLSGLTSAWNLHFSSDYFSRINETRDLGFSVRPLRGFATRVTVHEVPSAASTHLVLDCRTGVRVAAATETICFSPGWETTAAGAMATVTLNGVPVTNATEAGTFEWTPAQDGTFELSHAVFVNGRPIGETLRTTFTVAGLPETPFITPSGETVLESSQSVMISCVSDGAVIHYTTNGDEPTVDSPVYQTSFRVGGKTTVKAVAIYENGNASGVAEASFALGRCPDPVIESAGGDVFRHGSVLVSIDWECSDGVLRYTIDGCDVTETSPEYAGAFTIDDTTTIKAKAFGVTYFDSKQVELTVTREWEKVETPTVSASVATSGLSVLIDLACPDPDAELHYTLDGSEPNAESPIFIKPLYAFDASTLKVIAVKDDFADSDIVSKDIAIYCVIDLSGGPGSASYPVSHIVGVPPGGWTDEYKTTKLVLRKINVGSFIMGEDQANEERRVFLTAPFYMGVFEMTQKQYTLITGDSPSRFVGDTLPVERVTYNMIRGSNKGAQYPNSVDIDEDSFMGKLRARTGLLVDLPTEAQWEYTCRAGTTTTYSYGDIADGAYMWYKSNSGSCSHVVGTRNANPWGLYDMHGNVWEWCLDGTSESRVVRGGEWNDDAKHCASWWRGGDVPSGWHWTFGFRLVCAPMVTCMTEVPVELSWIREKFGDLGNYYYAYEEKAKEIAANGHKVWECYVAGEDPTDKDSRFTALIKIGLDGKPILSWKPPLNGETADGAGVRDGVRTYSVYGKQTLEDATEEWKIVHAGDEGNYRFFKVLVGMPESK